MTDPEKKGVPEESGGDEVAGTLPAIPPPVDPGLRALALVVDFVAVYFLVFCGGILAGILGAALRAPFLGHGLISGMANLIGAYYLLVRDSEQFGRSLGKRLTGLRVVGPGGENCTRVLSMRRNALLAAPFVLNGLSGFLMLIPVVGLIAGMGLGLVSLAAMVAVLFEGLQVLVLDRDGRRASERRSGAFTIRDR